MATRSSRMIEELINKVPNHNPRLKEFDKDLKRFHFDNRQSEETFRKRERFLELFREYLKSDEIVAQLQFTNITIIGVSAFGSFPTHIASKDSDMDLCVYGTNTGEKKQLSVLILQAIHRELQNSDKAQQIFGDHKIHDISFIAAAKVPIVRFKVDDVSFDVSSVLDGSPPKTILAAKYINAYCQLDDRFPVLVMFLKTWLRSEGSDSDHLRDFPNSYSITLLLIHVLQWYDVMPNLHQTHENLFHPGFFKSWSQAEMNHDFKFPLDQNISAVAMHRKRTSCHLNCVQLLYLFAYHYSHADWIGQKRFNMSSGKIQPRTRMTQDNAIVIVDVFDTRNPARTTRRAADFILALKSLVRHLESPSEKMVEKLMEITSKKTYIPTNAWMAPENNFPYQQYAYPPNVPPQSHPAYQNLYPPNLYGTHFGMGQVYWPFGFYQQGFVQNGYGNGPAS